MCVTNLHKKQNKIRRLTTVNRFKLIKLICSVYVILIRKTSSILVVNNKKKTKINFDAACICIETTKGKYSPISHRQTIYFTRVSLFSDKTKLLNTTFQYNKYREK